MNGAGGATGVDPQEGEGSVMEGLWVKCDSGLSRAVPLGGWSLLAWLHFIPLVEWPPSLCCPYLLPTAPHQLPAAPYPSPSALLLPTSSTCSLLPPHQLPPGVPLPAPHFLPPSPPALASCPWSLQACQVCWMATEGPRVVNSI